MARWRHTTLTGERVVLEPLEPRHEDDLRLAAADPAIFRHYSSDVSRAFDAWFRETLEAPRLAFATVDRTAGRAVGTTSFGALAPEHRRLEIGWTWLARAHWRTGANVEAKLLMLGDAFERLGVQRVEFKTDARNERSRAALLGIGAAFEGIHRKHMLVRDGEVRDTAWYSVVDDDWPGVRERLRARLARSPE